jgi:hypothetical protein
MLLCLSTQGNAQDSMRLSPKSLFARMQQLNNTFRNIDSLLHGPAELFSLAQKIVALSGSATIDSLLPSNNFQAIKLSDSLPKLLPDSMTNPLLSVALPKWNIALPFQKNDIAKLAANKEVKPPFLSFGSIALASNHTYRSFIDSPFSEQGLLQHQESVQGTVTVAGKYPFAFSFFGVQSNSQFLPDFQNISVVFDQQELERLKNQQMVERLLAGLPTAAIQKTMDSLLQGWQALDLDFNHLDAQFNNTVMLQMLQHCKENVVFPKEIPHDGARKDSILLLSRQYIQQYESWQNKLDSLQVELVALQKIKDDFTNNIRESISNLRTTIDPVKLLADLQQLRQKLNTDSLPDMSQWQTQASKWSLSQLSIGRTTPTVSGLTLNRSPLVGVHTKLKKGRHELALAAGFLDNNWRNAFRNGFALTDQYAATLGYKYAYADNGSVQFTGFWGRRYLNNSIKPRQFYHLFGGSIAVKQNIGSNHQLELELASSGGTRFSNAGIVERQQFSVFDKDNLAFQFNYRGYFPALHMRLVGEYRQFGLNYNSFGFNRNATAQTAYKLKLEQELWLRRLKITIGVSKNDFENPVLQQGLSGQQVFYTGMLSFRQRRLPFLSVAFMPVSIVTVVGNDFFENRYQSWNAHAYHNYKIGTALATSTVHLNHFVNNGGQQLLDTVFYSSNLQFSQKVQGKNVGLVATAQLNSYAGFNMQELTGVVSYTLAKTGMSWETGARVVHLEGVRAAAGWIAKANLLVLGCSVQLAYERLFFPSATGQLKNLDAGTLSFRKVIQ